MPTYWYAMLISYHNESLRLNNERVNDLWTAMDSFWKSRKTIRRSHTFYAAMSCPFKSIDYLAVRPLSRRENSWIMRCDHYFPSRFPLRTWWSQSWLHSVKSWEYLDRSECNIWSTLCFVAPTMIWRKKSIFQKYENAVANKKYNPLSTMNSIANSTKWTGLSVFWKIRRQRNTEKIAQKANDAATNCLQRAHTSVNGGSLMTNIRTTYRSLSFPCSFVRPFIRSFGIFVIEFCVRFFFLIILFWKISQFITPSHVAYIIYVLYSSQILLLFFLQFLFIFSIWTSILDNNREITFDFLPSLHFCAHAHMHNVRLRPR